MPLTPEEQRELAELEAWEKSSKPSAPTTPSALTPDEERELGELEAWEKSSGTTPSAAPSTPKSFDESLQSISQKYNVRPEILRKYALDIGSFEAAQNIQEKVSAGLGSVSESLFMGLPGKLGRKATGLAGGKQYEQALDEVTNLVNEKKSASQKIAEFGTAMTMPTGMLGKATGIAGKAALGAGTGALAGLGGSQAGQELSGVKTGAAVGGVLGAALPMAGRYLEKKGAETVASSLGVGATKKARAKMVEKGQTLEQKGQELMAKVPSIFSSVDDVYQQAQAGKKTIGAGIGKIIKEIDNLEASVGPDLVQGEGLAIANLLRVKATELTDTPKDRQLARGLLREAARYTKRDSVPLTKLQEMKVALDQRIIYDSKRNIDNTLDKKLRDAFNERIEQRVNRLDELSDQKGWLKDFKNIKQQYGDLAQSEKQMMDLMSRGFKPKEVSLIPNLKQTLGTLGAGAAGGPVAGAAMYGISKGAEVLGKRPGVGKALYETGKVIGSPAVTRETIKEIED